MADAQNLSNPDPNSRSAIDPAALMRIKSLQLRAKLVVDGFMSGLHRSPMHGSSVEFNEYRPYSPGDDLRNLDWKLYARSDRYFIKKFEDETNRRCYLVVDQSKSMGYQSLEYTKAEYARTVAATLGYFLTLQRDAIGLLTFDEGIGEFIPARTRPGQFHQILVGLSKPVRGTGTDLNLPLQQIAALIPRRGLVILISDLLAPVDSLQQNLAALRSRGHEVVVLRTLDPAEIELHLKAPSMVVDVETNREIYLYPEVARAQYRKQFDEHHTQVQQTCDALGVQMFRLVTDEALDNALLSIVDTQNRLGKSAARGGMLAGAARMRGSK
ncbi:DUF58 domain-containing protein [Stieleria varia]|uniref:VWA domain containing CoxE-like protein n=1 Tax=Stieleria varia TaxID=2528005 RepID=A0A5C6ASJ5_9BACT|nr:DUF58 domain-containing protein [Stieleria varia]TWU02407.1 VWA domain containing CoxE-like protein [Stieleria varia]